MGLDVYAYHSAHGGEIEDWESLAHASEKHPDHLFEVGYFRSSYNATGINRHLENHNLPTLYQMFNADLNDPNDVAPDWAECRKLLIDVQSKARERLGKYNVMKLSANHFVDPSEIPSDEGAALSKMVEVVEDDRHPDSFKSFSNSVGDFFIDGIKCYGFICGVDTLLGRPAPCVYVLVDAEWDWVHQAIEIIIETIDWAIETEEKLGGNVRLYFSG